MQTSDPPASPPPPGPDAGEPFARGPLRSSLLVQLVGGVLGIITVMSALMFLGIDGLVSMQFERIERDRIAQYAEDLRRALDRELSSLKELSRLISRDSNLNNSAQYHFWLEGEKRALQAAIDQIASNFSLGSVEVIGARDGRVVSVGTRLPTPSLPSDDGYTPLEPQTRMEWVGDTLWLVATSQLAIQNELLAVVQIGHPFDQMLLGARQLGAGVEVGMRTDGRPAPAGSVRIPVPTATGKDVAIELVVPNLVADALGQTKRLTLLTLVAISALLAVAITVYLRRQLRPLNELTRIAGTAAALLRDGQLRQVSVRGRGEVARLTDAFNHMLRDLANYARMERELLHQEQLTAIGRVATRVAHDINNPLTVIKNSAALMRRARPDDHPDAEDLDLIIRHCERCHRIVDNLLRFGRPLRLYPEPLELHGFIEDYLARRMRGERKQPYQVAGHPAALPFTGDPMQLEQMLDNLLDNAFEANGGGKIEVRLDADSDYVSLSLADHGPGFDPANLEGVFELYHTTKPNGTGLGLPNSRAIARAHGGDIRVTAPERGEVTVFLRRNGLPNEPSA